jgi:hypothetical protein
MTLQCVERGGCGGGGDFSFQVSLNSDRDDKTSIKREREKKDLQGGRKEVETINTVNTKNRKIYIETDFLRVKERQN